MSLILGINAAYHESSVCLLRDGEVVAALEEERLNRIKHAKPANIDLGGQLPLLALEWVLEDTGVQLSEVESIGFSFVPRRRLEFFAKREGQEPSLPGEWGTKEGEERFFQSLESIPQQLSQLAKVDLSQRFHWLGHHLCHAASAFYPSPYSEAAILTVDGIGEAASTHMARGEGKRIQTLGEIPHPHSLGLLWEKMAQFLGFGEYDAYKVMGLAANGKADAWSSQMDQLLWPAPGGLFQVNAKIASFRTPDFSGLEALFGTRREAGQPLEQRHADVAASLQSRTEEILLSLAWRLHRQTGLENLCLAGGVALNCVANAAILEHGPFTSVYIQPAAHDAGTALGAALLLWHKQSEEPRQPKSSNCYTGPEYAPEELEAAISAAGLTAEWVEDIEGTTAELLAQGAVVGWFQGRLEFGPRALGQRSLLADPRDPEMRDRLNLKVKHRESFRPFAPSVLSEQASEWFEIPRSSPSTDAMLFAFRVRPEKQARIPAVVHLDGTSRVQTVRLKKNPRFHRLIREFEARTGIPMLLNTSFNDQEPIVCSPQDALRTFQKTEMDALVLGNYLIQSQELER